MDHLPANARSCELIDKGALFRSEDRLLELEGTRRLSSPVVCRLFLFSLKKTILLTQVYTEHQ